MFIFLKDMGEAEALLDQIKATKEERVKTLSTIESCFEFKDFIQEKYSLSDSEFKSWFVEQVSSRGARSLEGLSESLFEICFEEAFPHSQVLEANFRATLRCGLACLMRVTAISSGLAQ